MKRRNVFKFVIALAFAAAMPFAQAQSAKAINPVQPGGGKSKIEVIEFFSYGCPHCNDFDPILNAWRAKQPSDISLRRVPISFGRKVWSDLSQIYLTLNAMGIADKHGSAVFNALHGSSPVNLGSELVRNQWLAQQKIDVAKFNQTWKSFAVTSALEQSEQMARSYNVQGVPALAIDGRFWAEGKDFNAMLESADAIIAKIRTEKGLNPSKK